MPSTNPADKPMVTVLLATHNGEQFLREQLESIETQTYPHWHIIAMDDGSDDKTLDILNEFQGRHADKFDIQRAAPIHSAKQTFFRLVLTNAKSHYFAFCDQDDVWEPHKLERMVLAMATMERQHVVPRPSLAFSDLSVVDRDLNLQSKSFMKDMRVRPHDLTFSNILTENSVPGCSMIFNEHLVEIVRQHPDICEHAIMHDWWVLLLAKATGEITYVPEPLVRYRQHSNNSLGAAKRTASALLLTKLNSSRRQDRGLTYRQAHALVSHYSRGMSSHNEEIARTYASLTLKKKPVRAYKCWRTGTLKQGFVRRIYQLITA